MKAVKTSKKKKGGTKCQVISITASCGGQGCHTHYDILPQGIKKIHSFAKAV